MGLGLGFGAWVKFRVCGVEGWVEDSCISGTRDHETLPH